MHLAVNEPALLCVELKATLTCGAIPGEQIANTIGGGVSNGIVLVPSIHSEAETIEHALLHRHSGPLSLCRWNNG